MKYYVADVTDFSLGGYDFEEFTSLEAAMIHVAECMEKESEFEIHLGAPDGQSMIYVDGRGLTEE